MIISNQGNNLNVRSWHLAEVATDYIEGVYMSGVEGRTDQHLKLTFYGDTDPKQSFRAGNLHISRSLCALLRI